MTGYTPIYSLPYPQPSDLVSAYPGVGQDLAEEVETVLAAKAPLASPTFTGNVVWSGATLRASGASVLTEQSTTSTSFTDLATSGPSVTLTTGTKALIVFGAGAYNSTTAYSRMSFAVSGATTLTASDDYKFEIYTSTGQIVVSGCYSVVLTGLTAGSNTFTCKYKASSGTASFYNRRIYVMDLGS